MPELTLDQKAEIEKVAERLAVITGSDTSAVAESLRKLITGDDSSRDEDVSGEPYIDPENTPYFFSETEKYNPDALVNPEWPRPDRWHVHEWKDYIPEGLRERWDSLSQETKEVAYYMAKEQADNEMWT